MRLRLIHINQLKLLEKHLYSEYKKNMMFKRIYESNNKKSKIENKDIEEMIINNPELFSVIDSVSTELANYIMGKNDSAKELFEGSGRHLTIDNCFTLLKVIHEVINMLEDDLRTGRISLQ